MLSCRCSESSPPPIPPPPAPLSLPAPPQPTPIRQQPRIPGAGSSTGSVPLRQLSFGPLPPGVGVAAQGDVGEVGGEGVVGAADVLVPSIIEFVLRQQSSLRQSPTKVNLGGVARARNLVSGQSTMYAACSDRRCMPTAATRVKQQGCIAVPSRGLPTCTPAAVHMSGFAALCRG